MIALKTLYKKSSSTDKISQWSIRVEPSNKGFAIITEFGEVEGKIQTTSDVITSGKNEGRSNETTPEQQAIAEATSRWEKKLKSGHCQSFTDAQAGKRDKLVKGGCDPMLAHSYRDHASKISFPCFAQPKLDGIRCIAIREDDEVTLWTRNRKPILSCPHIEEAVLHLPKELFGNVILDGELYNHDLKKDFSRIVSAVKRDKPSEEAHLVEYHVYDIIEDNLPFSSRLEKVNSIKSTIIKPVKTFHLSDEKSVTKVFRDCISKGYEGAILRNTFGHYEHKRSYNLQKVKEFDTEEFRIIGVEEGRGKLTGHAATFICLTKDDKEFSAKISGPTEELEKYLKRPSSWKGKEATVQFQGYTSANGVPRFPVAIAIRDYE